MIDNTPKTKETMTHERLYDAIKSTYADTKFIVGVSLNNDRDFSEGMTDYRLRTYTKRTLLGALLKNKADKYTMMEKNPDNIVIHPHLFVSIKSIIENQQYDTPKTLVKGYHYIVADQHYDIYFNIDHEKKTVSFRLGEHEKTVPLVEGCKDPWKVFKTQIQCKNTKELEKTWLQPHWCRWVVYYARKHLMHKPF